MNDSNQKTVFLIKRRPTIRSLRVYFLYCGFL